MVPQEDLQREMMYDLLASLLRVLYRMLLG